VKNADFDTLCREIDRRLTVASPLLLAIDGRCGSGKTTLALHLREHYGEKASLYRMDDFFLPFELRTPERMAQPSGHMDAERFQREVLLPLKRGDPFTYGVYDCQTGTMQEKPGSVTPLAIMEGSYSLHPLLREFYDVKVFMTTDIHTQRQRLLAREGETRFQRFLTDWIPREESYFSAYQIEQSADFIITT
jgi:uridine kinase